MVRALRRQVLLAWFGVFVLVLVLVLSPREAFAQGRVEIEKARAAYLARSYPEAEERLRGLVDPKGGLKELPLLSQARMYLGAVLRAQGKADAAVEVFEKMILEDPTFEPDPLSFPGDVINTFFDVRGQLQEKIRQAAQNAARLEAERRARADEDRKRQEAWLAKIKQMAAEEKITVRHSRLVAFLPFGVGQLQNGDRVLGWTLLATEAACVLGTGITVPMYSYARGRAEDEARSGDLERKAQTYQDRADNIRTVNLSFTGAFAALAITGIVQANMAFVPESVETRTRELPPLSRLTPVVSTLSTLSTGGLARPTGVFVGLRGLTF